jgi:hypothetical protein
MSAAVRPGLGGVEEGDASGCADGQGRQPVGAEVGEVVGELTAAGETVQVETVGAHMPAGGGFLELWQAMRAAYGEQMITGLAAVVAVLAGEPGPGLPDDVATRIQELARTEQPVDLADGLTERSWTPPGGRDRIR